MTQSADGDLLQTVMTTPTTTNALETVMKSICGTKADAARLTANVRARIAETKNKTPTKMKTPTKTETQARQFVILWRDLRETPECHQLRASGGAITAIQAA